jgi:hypothetical protein
VLKGFQKIVLKGFQKNKHQNAIFNRPCSWMLRQLPICRLALVSTWSLELFKLFWLWSLHSCWDIQYRMLGDGSLAWVYVIKWYDYVLITASALAQCLLFTPNPLSFNMCRLWLSKPSFLFLLHRTVDFCDSLACFQFSLTVNSIHPCLRLDRSIRTYFSPSYYPSPISFLWLVFCLKVLWTL